MRKFLALLLATVMCCGTLVGCGGKPKELSQEVYDMGVETCNLLENYIQGKMSQSTCKEKIDEVNERASEYEESNETNTSESLVLTYIFTSGMSVSDLYVEEGETYKAEESLKELKEKLNLK